MNEDVEAAPPKEWDQRSRVRKAGLPKDIWARRNPDLRNRAGVPLRRGAPLPGGFEVLRFLGVFRCLKRVALARSGIR